MSTIALRQISEFGFEASSEAGWRLTIEVKPEDGGKAAGPTPTELVAIGLAACKGVTALKWAKARQVALKNLELDVSYEMAENPRRIGAMTIALHHVKAQVEQTQLARLETALHGCYVARTLEIPPVVTSVIE